MRQTCNLCLNKQAAPLPVHGIAEVLQFSHNPCGLLVRSARANWRILVVNLNLNTPGRNAYMQRLLMLICAGLLLAGCGGGGDNASTAGGSANVDNNPIQWNRDPQNIVFRADVRGGESVGSPTELSEIPVCTIYGDNRVVWVVNATDDTTQVLFDHVDDLAIRNFVDFLVVGKTYFEYSAQADLQSAGGVTPVVETLFLNVNDTPHDADTFGGLDYDDYLEIVAYCQSLSQSPVIYEPEGAWVRAIAVEYNPAIPAIFWDAQANGLNLAELAASGEQRWITGAPLRILWDRIRTTLPGTRFEQEFLNYEMILQVPNISRYADPPPS